MYAHCDSLVRVSIQNTVYIVIFKLLSLNCDLLLRHLHYIRLYRVTLQISKCQKCSTGQSAHIRVRRHPGYKSSLLGNR
jgi:hypothetical protein